MSGSLRTPLRRTCLLVCLAAFAATLWPATASAAPRVSSVKESDDDAVEAAAKTRYSEGLRLYSKKRYDEARVAFLQANMLKRRPAATLMLGLASLKVGRWVEAARELDAYAAEAGNLPAKLRDLVDAARREARSHLGRLRFDVPEGAEITIDDQPVANVREPVDVAAGKHTVVVTHRGEKKTEIVDAVEDTTVEVKPAFVPKALVPTADTRTRPTLPPKPESTQEAGTSILSPPETTWPVYVLGGIGLGGLASAAIFGGLTLNSNHAVDVSRETLVRDGQSLATCKARPVEARYDDICETLRKNEELARSHQGIFTASAVVGISATAIAFGWFLFAPKERGDAPPSGRTRVVPWVGLGNGGATVEGRF